VMNGPVQTLADTGSNLGGAWSRDGVILFNADPPADGRMRLGRVSASGGDVSSISLEDSNVQRQSFIFVGLPRFLPDARHFLYHVITVEGPSFAGTLHVRSLDGGPPVRLANLGSVRPDSADGNSTVSFVAPRYLLFTRGGTLMSQTFDVDRLQVTGEAVAIAENVSNFAASNTGVLVYTHAPLPNSNPTAFATAQQLTWFTRSGKVEGQLGTRTYTNPKISPDRRRVVAQTVESGTNTDIWTLDVASGVPSKLTFDPAGDAVPLWSPTGDRIVFASARNTPIPFASVLYTRASSGAGEDQVLLPPAKTNELNVAQDWSPDGRYIVYGVVPLQRLTSGDLWALPLFGDKKPIPLVQPKAGIAGAARFSPDGRWLAYTTTESGSSQIVIRPFPETSKGIWQVPGGGSQPVWRGREIFYLSSDLRAMMTVPVTAANNQIEFGRPVELFKFPVPLPQTNPPQFLFDVTPDGQRFLVNLPANAAAPQTSGAPVPPTPINVVVNWTAMLSKK
jgi:eukaryotic-like serine/threonine-protein kinase